MLKQGIGAENRRDTLSVFSPNDSVVIMILSSFFIGERRNDSAIRDGLLTESFIDRIIMVPLNFSVR